MVGCDLRCHHNAKIVGRKKLRIWQKQQDRRERRKRGQVTTQKRTPQEAAELPAVDLWWQGRGEERLYRSQDDAIEDALDALRPAVLPDTLELVACKPMQKWPTTAQHYASNLLETLIESLSSDYSSCEDCAAALGEVPAELTDKLRAAVHAIVDWYPVTNLVETGVTVQIDVQAWVQAHRPEWLTPTAAQGEGD